MANETQDPSKEYAFPWHSYKKIHLTDDEFVFSVPNYCRHHGSRLTEQTTFGGDSSSTFEIDEFAKAYWGASLCTEMYHQGTQFMVSPQSAKALSLRGNTQLPRNLIPCQNQ